MDAEFNEKDKLCDDKPSPIGDAYLENEQALRQYLSRYCRNNSDIDGVCQEAFLRSYQCELDPKTTIRSPKSFLFKVAKNIALKRILKKANVMTSYIEDLANQTVLSSGVSVFREVDSQEKLRVFTKAVASLPERCREAFLLRKVYGKSQKEIASALKIAESTVEKHIATGLRRCIQYMKIRTDYFDSEDDL